MNTLSEIIRQIAIEEVGVSEAGSNHATKPGITETILQTEMIRDAGDYRPNSSQLLR